MKNFNSCTEKSFDSIDPKNILDKIEKEYEYIDNCYLQVDPYIYYFNIRCVGCVW